MDIRVRPATIKDAKFLLRVKNQIDVRKNSIVTEEKIKWKDHIKWLRKALNTSVLYVISYKGKNCGDIRFDIYSGYTEVSIRLLKKYRGFKIATFVIMVSCNKFITRAKTVEGNFYSMNVFIKNNFKIIDYKKINGKGVYIWEKKLLRS